ncbi:vasopressin V1b receptor-like isoform X1 [Penaeus monodon]|uniref:vasopressin V1b receptor-like isoform X1 n=1 Tax=Penaeus monodon TaxID=6687 RepID=UPI0018A6F23B|nr:vasopressin V1b receptor-like isoform X1 [Penaeus monodon]
MENLDDFDREMEEIALGNGVTARRQPPPQASSGNWLEHAFNDSDCLVNSDGSECQMNATLLGNSSTTDLPPSLGFDDNAMTDIIVYCVLFIVAAIGNFTVFITLFRNRHRKSRVNLMIMHLAVADLMVTLINFPLEVGWRITTQWVAGNLACKLFQFLRAFGLYLSSLVLVCISLDRYFAIVHPLKVNDAQRRGKMMLSFAWSIAAVCSIPQSVIFHVDSHPVFKNFKQCVTFGFFQTQVEERTYNLFCLAAMYFMPLLIIIVVYLRILWEISQKSKDSKDDPSGGGRRDGRLRLRRSDMTNIERARARTLRMTLIIVLAFVWCWTPYVVIVMWYMFDRQSAMQVDKPLQDALFIMAVSNSCVNPLVYGTYTINFRNELNRCFGRKKKPPVLARKSTVLGSQDLRGPKVHARFSVSFPDPARPTGSTAMRTTVTAQLSHSNALRMSTHTQVVNHEGRSESWRNPLGGPREAPTRYTPPKQQLPSPPTPQSPPAASSPQLPSSSVASGCVMVEIEVDVNKPRAADGKRSPTKANNGSLAEDKSADLFHAFKGHCMSSQKEMVKLTGFTQRRGTPPHALTKHDSGRSTDDQVCLDRKLSSDSGVYVDSRHKRNALHDGAPGQAAADKGGARELHREPSIELSCIGGFSSET